MKSLMQRHIKMTEMKILCGMWVAKLEEKVSFIGIPIRTNRIICSDYVLTSSLVVPTINNETGYVSDYPVNKADLLSAVQNQYKCFLGEVK
jgi:hypothetical protein